VKALNPLWRDGRLIEMTYQGAWATPAAFAIAQLDLPARAYDVAAWGVILFEMSLGPALYWPRTRGAAMLLGTAFHLANWVLLDIPEFMVCVATYVLFVPGEAVRRWGGCARGAQPVGPRGD
jgi:hypothetical protein